MSVEYARRHDVPPYYHLTSTLRHREKALTMSYGKYKDIANEDYIVDVTTSMPDRKHDVSVHASF